MNSNNGFQKKKKKATVEYKSIVEPDCTMNFEPSIDQQTISPSEWNEKEYKIY